MVLALAAALVAGLARNGTSHRRPDARTTVAMQPRPDALVAAERRAQAIELRKLRAALVATERRAATAARGRPKRRRAPKR
jgi:hypothetical protein